MLDRPEPRPGQTRTSCRTNLNHLPRTLEPPEPLPGTTRRTRQNHLTDTPKSYLLDMPKSPAGYARTTCRTDRKSTRLNSSHANISYAVFCLKKKNLPSPPSPFLPLPFHTPPHS